MKPSMMTQDQDEDLFVVLEKHKGSVGVLTIAQILFNIITYVAIAYESS